MRGPSRTLRVAHEGSPGAFSESAIDMFFPGQQPVACSKVDDLFAKLASGEVDAAVLPLDSTLGGRIPEVYEGLRANEDVKIVAELVLRVRQYLLGIAGARLEGIRVARSSPRSLQQVSEFLDARGILRAVAFDPPSAAAEVAAAGQLDVAAVASRGAAQRYGLAVICPIDTVGQYLTRFVAVLNYRHADVAAQIPDRLRGGPVKTSLVFGVADLSSDLVSCLEPLSSGGIRLRKVESYPNPGAPWTYDFFVEFEGDPSDSRAAEALTKLGRRSSWSRVLGVYRGSTEVCEPD